MFWNEWTQIGDQWVDATPDAYGHYNSDRPDGRWDNGLCLAIDQFHIGMEDKLYTQLNTFRPRPNLRGYVGYWWSITSRQGVEDRLMAIAFLATMPKDMMP